VASAEDTAVRQERARNASWVLKVRIGLSLISLLSVAPFDRPQARALTPWVALLCAFNLGLWLASRRRPAVLARSFLAIPLVDLPFLLLVQWLNIRNGAPAASAVAGTASLSIVGVIFTLFSLDLPTVVATAVVTMVLQLGSWWFVGHYTANTLTIMLIALAAGTAAVGLTHRLRTLLREKNEALSQVTRDLRQLTVQFQPGQLTGVMLDGKYRIGELLGRGGMGEVYGARESDQEVAVKVLFAHLSDREHVISRFRREAKLVSQLPATLIAPVRAIGATADGLHYLVMELLRGEDLGARLRRRGRLPIGELLPIIDCLAEALAAAHALGVVHRDLKPGKVFLVENDAAGPVRLLDFGIARADSVTNATLTGTSVVLGTPGYLAPEQVAPRVGAVGPATDCFALGALTFRALTGENAFLASNPAQAAYEALNAQPPPPSKLEPELPVDVDAVIALALAKRIEDRYQDARAFARDLRAAAAAALPGEVRDRARRIARSSALDDTL
jgi:hypothetical protein